MNTSKISFGNHLFLRAGSSQRQQELYNHIENNIAAQDRAYSSSYIIRPNGLKDYGVMLTTKDDIDEIRCLEVLSHKYPGLVLDKALPVIFSNKAIQALDIEG